MYGILPTDAINGNFFSNFPEIDADGLSGFTRPGKDILV